MIKKTILSKIICATVLLSPLVMTGCETFGGLFGESPRYSYPESYGHRKMEPNQRIIAPSNQGASEAATPTSRRVRHSPAAVPLEAPTVHHSSHSASSSSNNASTSGSNAASQNAMPTTTTVPSVPTSSSATTVTPATGMEVPTVGQ